MSFSALLSSVGLTLAAQHGAHVHGHAELTIALEPSGMLQVEFIASAHDIYGFEHEARNDAQRAIIAQAEAILTQTSGLLDLGRAECLFSSAEIVHADEPDDHEDHHEDGHDEHHDDGHADEHSNVHVVYSGTCDRPERMRSVRTTLFEHFDELAEIEGLFVSTEDQSAFELTPSSPSARLSE